MKRERNLGESKKKAIARISGDHDYSPLYNKMKGNGKVTIDHKMDNGTDRSFQDSVVELGLSYGDRERLEESLGFFNPFECFLLKIQ